MPQDDRQHYRQHGRGREAYRGEPYEHRRDDWMRPGEDRDPYRAGDETRYMADWRERSDQRGFEGGRSYPRSGYAEEFGRRGRSQSDERREHETRAAYDQGGAYGRMRWGEHEDAPDYYGTGSYYGGGYGTAPSTQTSGSGSWGASGYAGRGAWSEREDWLPENERATSGDYANYGRSQYGAQSGYGREYGGVSQQSFRGRGPKGYERSDERLKEVICERLTDDPRIDASDVNVEVNQKIVKLTGTVPERRTKYQIEDLIERCGAKDVDNQLRVQQNPLWSGAETTGSMSSTSSTTAAGAKTAEGRSSGSSSTKRS